MMLRLNLVNALASLAVVTATAAGGDLEPAKPICDARGPIDVQHSGHAAPFVGDFDGDGLKDLLVGEYYKGRLRVYRNVGTNEKPQFDGYALFQDGAPDGCIWAS